MSNFFYQIKCQGFTLLLGHNLDTHGCCYFWTLKVNQSFDLNLHLLTFFLSAQGQGRLDSTSDFATPKQSRSKTGEMVFVNLTNITDFIWLAITRGQASNELERADFLTITSTLQTSAAINFALFINPVTFTVSPCFLPLSPEVRAEPDTSPQTTKSDWTLKSS